MSHYKKVIDQPLTLKYHPPLSRLSHSNHHLLFELLYLQKRMNYFKALFHYLICMCSFSAMQCCSMPMLSCLCSTRLFGLTVKLFEIKP